MHFHFDGEEYCEDCLPGPGEPDYGEQDYPAHCCRCHKPLDCTLTKDGVAYVMGKKCYAIGTLEKTETLYHIFDKIFPSLDDFVKEVALA